MNQTNNSPSIWRLLDIVSVSDMHILVTVSLYCWRWLSWKKHCCWCIFSSFHGKNRIFHSSVKSCEIVLVKLLTEKKRKILKYFYSRCIFSGISTCIVKYRLSIHTIHTTNDEIIFRKISQTDTLLSFVANVLVWKKTSI